MRHPFALLPLLCLLTIGHLQAQKETFVFVERDSALRLDVWQPEEPRADKACVVALFGGGFVNGSRDNKLQTEIATLLTQRGYTVVNIDYRLGLKDSAMVAQHSSLAKMRTLFQWVINIATEDCSAAIRWVVEHADELNIDPSRIILTGSSAGAITVLQTDYCRANNLAAAASLPSGWKPAAIVAYSGAVMCKGKPKYNTAPAPTMLMHGTKDKIVAYKRFPPVVKHALYGASTLFSVFKDNGHPAWIIRYKGIGHEVASFLPGSVDLFCAYAEQVFNGRVTTLDATASDSRLLPTEWTNMNVFDLYK